MDPKKLILDALVYKVKQALSGQLGELEVDNASVKDDPMFGALSATINLPDGSFMTIAFFEKVKREAV